MRTSCNVKLRVHCPSCYSYMPRDVNLYVCLTLGAFIINCLCILIILFAFGWKDDMIEYILCLLFIIDYNISH